MKPQPRAPRRLARAKKQLSEMPVGGLRALFAPYLPPLPNGDNSSALIYSPENTFWLFLYQVITPGAPCQQVVHKALAWLFASSRQKASTNNSGYVQARKRLSLPWLIDLARSISDSFHTKADQWLWLGRRVLIVDGSSVSMPDTQDNQGRWPQPSGQRLGCGFPMMRIVAVFCLATGALIDLASGPKDLGERTLWRMLWGRLRRGDVVVSDRGFCSFAEFYLLLDRGIDMVARLHARRSVGVRKVKRLGKGDRLVEWIRDKHCPNWMEWSWRKELPKTMLVREVTFTVSVRQFRARSITVATTLLDPIAYPREALAELYRRRWEAELHLRELKTTMGMEVLRCKSPDMIEKELTMHWIAYNLIRATMVESAQKHDGDPVSLSFSGCIQLIREWEPELAAARDGERAREFKECVLEYLAKQIVRRRPNRREPRALKRRPKTYARLNQPRNQFQEIPHRNRYKKPEVSPTVTST